MDEEWYAIRICGSVVLCGWIIMGWMSLVVTMVVVNAVVGESGVAHIYLSVPSGDSSDPELFLDDIYLPLDMR